MFHAARARMDHWVGRSFLELCAFSFFSALKGALPRSDVAKNLTGIYHSTPACKNWERYASESHISLKVALAVTASRKKMTIFFTRKHFKINTAHRTKKVCYLKHALSTSFQVRDNLRFKLSREGKQKIGRIPGRTRVSSFMQDKKEKRRRRRRREHVGSYITDRTWNPLG